MRPNRFLPSIALGLVFFGAGSLAAQGFQDGKAGKRAAKRLVGAPGSSILIAARALAAGDVNGDRRPDVVATHNDRRSVS